MNEKSSNATSRSTEGEDTICRAVIFAVASFIAIRLCAIVKEILKQ